MGSSPLLVDIIGGKNPFEVVAVLLSTTVSPMTDPRSMRDAGGKIIHLGSNWKLSGRHWSLTITEDILVC